VADASFDPLIGRLRRVLRLANQQASMHGGLSDYYGRWSAAITFCSLLLAVILLALVFASDFVQRTTPISADAFQWATGIAAIVNFLFTLWALAWRPASKAAGHRQGVVHYTKAKYEVGRRLDSDEAITAEAVRQIEERYLDTRDLPNIPDRRFLKLKRRHLEKVAVSKELDKNPHESIFSIRRRLRRSRQNETNSTDNQESVDQS
jgi:hypothetical protein